MRKINQRDGHLALASLRLSMTTLFRPSPSDNVHEYRPGVAFRASTIRSNSNTSIRRCPRS